MKRYILGCLVFLVVVSCQQTQELFQENNKDWITEGNAQWSFNNNELTGTVKNDEVGFVMTKESYKNFVLELEFKPDDTINSGVFIRCKNYELSADDCYEVNIWDLHPNQAFRTGAVVKKGKPLAIVETNGKWNTYKIKIENNVLKVWINEVLTAIAVDSNLKEGYIGLQASGNGSIKFRNINLLVIN